MTLVFTFSNYLNRKKLQIKCCYYSTKILMAFLSCFLEKRSKIHVYGFNFLLFTTQTGLHVSLCSENKF